MNWLDEVIDRLERVGSVVDSLMDEGADVLRKGGEILDLLADAARRAADVVDPTPAGALCVAGRERLLKIKAEFEARRDAPRVKAFPWELLIPVIISLIEKIIDRRFPAPDPA